MAFFLQILGFITIFYSITCVQTSTSTSTSKPTSNSISNLISNTNIETNIIERFENWFIQHKITSRDNSHLVQIFENWIDNDKFISIINAKNLSYTLGHNSYSGMNTEEFGQYMNFNSNQNLLIKNNGNEYENENENEYRNLRGNIPIIKQNNISDLKDLASSIDWRTKGVVGDIRNQLQCGSCYSFSGTSTIESAVAIKTGKLYDLSEQETVSCAGIKYGNLGCNGGYYSGIWDFSKDNNGICSEESYPYTSGNGASGSCVKGCIPVSGTKVQSYVDVIPNSDSSMMSALNVGTISIAIEADTRTFQLYSQGIYSDFEGCNGNSKTKGVNSQPNIDHAVVLVGYGTENGQDYYILRNSWGNTWGENGYQRISRGTQYGPFGMCGVLYDPMYPVV